MESITLDTLSRLKGIETFLRCRLLVLPWAALDTLSRLKGIETRRSVRRLLLLPRPFGYPFPFEGNWNFSLAWIIEIIKWPFGYPFPFEGNWNLRSAVDFRNSFVAALDTLSRLKGIETGIQDDENYVRNATSLDTLSRLKGIETNWGSNHISGWILWIPFPVWRELKPMSAERVPSPFGLWIPFPVWRELKHEEQSASPCIERISLDTLSRLKGMKTN